MRIAFIYPPQSIWRPISTEKIYRQNSREGAILPPLGIAYLASSLERDHIVKIVDANALRLAVDEVIKELDLFKPDLLLFTLITPNFRVDLEWIKAIKKKHDIPVIVGGPHATLYPSETLTFTVIDFCVIGEAWETLPELIGCVDDKNGCRAVKGIAFRQDGEIVVTEKRQGRMNIDNASFPARHLLPNEKYTTILSKRHPVTTMLSSSGCPFQCVYCPHDNNVVFRDPIKVVDEMEECRVRFKIKEIDFYDDIFSLDKERVMRICEEIIRRKLDVAWSIRTRPDCVDEALIKLFAKAGCARIHYGIESASPEILRMMKRDIPFSRITDVVRWTRREKIDVLGFFIIGFPGENRQNIFKTIALAKELDFDYVQINKLLPLPNTELYALLKEKSGRDFWREYVLGRAEEPKGFPSLDSNMSADELDDCLREAYRSFYLRPDFIFRTLLKVKSFKELRGLINSALSL